MLNLMVHHVTIAFKRLGLTQEAVLGVCSETAARKKKAADVSGNLWL